MSGIDGMREPAADALFLENKAKLTLFSLLQTAEPVTETKRSYFKSLNTWQTTAFQTVNLFFPCSEETLTEYDKYLLPPSRKLTPETDNI